MATGTITVTGDRTVAAGSSSPTLCINTALTDITHSTTGVTTILSSSGLPSGLLADYSGNTITISGTPTESGVFNYTITPDGCGSEEANGTIIINDLPVVNLGNDTSICADSTLVIDVVVGVNWSWNTGETSQQITVDAEGDYDVMVTDGNGCINYDTVNVLVNPLPLVNLGNDTSICADSTITFDAEIGVDWSWNTGEVSKQISVNTAGDFDVVVTDANGCVNYDTVNLIIYALPIVDLGADTSICSNNSIIIGIEGDYEFEWNTLDTGRNILVFLANDYSLRVEDENGCVNYDTITIGVYDLPVVNIGEDTSICSGDTLEIDAVVGEQWEWSNGLTTQTILLTQAGDYSVTVTDTNGCENNDEMSLSMYELPLIDLGVDTAVCEEDSITLSIYSGASWLWNNGATSSSVTVNLSGDYFASVTDSNGCINYDTIYVSKHTAPVVELGNDTTICREHDFEISAYAPSAVSILWNDGTETFSRMSTGAHEYSITVMDVHGCVNYDTLDIDTFESPVPVINIQDTSICMGDSVGLEVEDVYVFYAWTNTSSTSYSANVHSTNEYVLRVFDNNGCLGSDTAHLEVFDLPHVEIGDSARFCAFKPLILQVPEVYAAYLWNTGNVERLEEIDAVGQYWVDVTDTNGCFNSDSVWIVEGEQIPVDLGEDTTICVGSSLILNASFVHQEIWQSTDTAETYDVGEANVYDVLVIDNEGCFGRDTIEVFVSPLPSVEIIQGDSLPLCEGASEVKTLELLNAEGMDVIWSTGEQQNQIEVDYTGSFTVSRINMFECVGSDTIEVFEFCKPVSLSMPNVFTPDDDGINETFIPLESPNESIEFITSHTTKMNFKVVNRWGRPVFNSSDVLPNWDGVNLETGEECAPGTYYWILEYADLSGGNYQLNGFVQLIR